MIIGSDHTVGSDQETRADGRLFIRNQIDHLDLENSVLQILIEAFGIDDLSRQ